MSEINFKNLTAFDLEQLTIDELRSYWTAAWAIPAHNRLGRKMLTKSLLYKIHEANGLGLGFAQQQKLDQLVRAYKRSREVGAKRQARILPGTQLVRIWKGQQQAVIVLEKGYNYNGKMFSSVSAIAFAITGVRWNGWAFFGVTKPAAQSEAG